MAACWGMDDAQDETDPTSADASGAETDPSPSNDSTTCTITPASEATQVSSMPRDAVQTHTGDPVRGCLFYVGKLLMVAASMRPASHLLTPRPASTRLARPSPRQDLTWYTGCIADHPSPALIASFPSRSLHPPRSFSALRSMAVCLPLV